MCKVNKHILNHRIGLLLVDDCSKRFRNAIAFMLVKT